MEDFFVVLSISAGNKVTCKIVDISREENMSVCLETEEEIKIGEISLMLKN